MKLQNTTGLLLFLCSSLLLFSCQEQVPHAEAVYEGPPKGHIITVERAQEMYDAYSQRRVPLIQAYEDSLQPAKEKFEPTRYAEFNLETVKQYIAYIEHEAKQANVDINTLRFYLSNYPAADKFPNGDVVKFPKRNSIFVVPTMDYKGKNVGFSIEEVDGKYTAVPIKSRSSVPEKTNDAGESQSMGKQNKAGFFSSATSAVTGPGTTSLILNDSHIAPPPGPDEFGSNN